MKLKFSKITTTFLLVLFGVTLQNIKIYANSENETTLKDYLKIIEMDNPKLKSINHKYESLLNKSKVASYLPDPKFTAGYYLQSVETKVGPQKMKFGISQHIPFKGKLDLKEKNIKEKAEAILQQYSQTKNQLENDFSKNFYNLSFLEKQIEIYNDHLILFKDFAITLKSSYESSVASYDSLLRVDIEIDKLEDRINTLNDMKNPIIAKLNSILNRESGSEIKITHLNEFQLENLSENQKMENIDNLFVTNPKLKSLAHIIKSNQVIKKLAKKNYYPDFNVGLDWINTGSSNVEGVAGSGKDALIIKAGINIPLMRNKYKAIEIEADEEYLNSVETQVDFKNSLEAKLKKAYFDYDDSIRKQKLYKDSIIPKAEEALKVLISSFETERSNYIDIIDSERILLEFQLNYEKALKDTLISISEIKFLTGKNN